MSDKRKKILVVATSKKTRGGITAVINAHAKGSHWKTYRIKWIESHIDRNLFLKISYFMFSLIQFFFLIPFYDLVHFHVSTYSSVFRKSFYLYLALLYNKKIITHLHCSTSSILYKKENKSLYRNFFLKSDLVLVLSTQWEQHLYDALGIRDNVKILYNPIVTMPSIKSHIEKKKQILFAGTINKRKGYHDLIRSFQNITIKHPDWKLILAGNGEVEEGKQLAESLGILSFVDFRGWVSGKDKEVLFKESSIFCLPSYAEGFPMSVLDAWAFGLPVICTPVGGIPDIAEDGENILLFEPGDITQLTDRIDILITDPTLRNKIAEESCILSKTIFNLENINKKLENFYKELLDK